MPLSPEADMELNILSQMCKFLNVPRPRPGTSYRLEIGIPTEPEKDITLESVFPGELDYDKGSIKTDFQLWPLMQALDVDHIITCIEVSILTTERWGIWLIWQVALSNSGRIIFCSQFPAMTSLAVNCLRYIVDSRGWTETCVPTVHAVSHAYQ